MYKVIMDKSVNYNYTFCQDCMDITYSQLVEIFGKPNGLGDDYKVDAEWIGTINGKVFTIYNWKDGKNYLGKEGLATKDITEWHIGGYDKETADTLWEYIMFVYKDKDLALLSKDFIV